MHPVQQTPAFYQWKTLEKLSAKCSSDASYRNTVLTLYAHWLGPEERRPKKILEVDASSERFSGAKGWPSSFSSSLFQ